VKPSVPVRVEDVDQQRARQIVIETVNRSIGSKNHVFSKTTWGVSMKTLCHMVHEVIWRDENRVLDMSYPPYTQRSTISVYQTLQTLVPDLKQLLNQWQLMSLTAGIYSILSQHQLMCRLGRHAGGSTVYYLREWPEDFQLEWRSPNKFTWLVVDKAEEKVSSKLDIGQISLPDQTPESVLAYVKKVIPLVKELQTEYSRLRDENIELRRLIRDLKSSPQWREIADEIRELVET
jgi:hypothetical protein